MPLILFSSIAVDVVVMDMFMKHSSSESSSVFEFLSAMPSGVSGTLLGYLVYILCMVALLSVVCTGLYTWVTILFPSAALTFAVERPNLEGRNILGMKAALLRIAELIDYYWVSYSVFAYLTVCDYF